jgi:hypothetical protein
MRSSTAATYPRWHAIVSNRPDEKRINLQCAGRDGRQKADVPHRLQAQQVHCARGGYFEWAKTDDGKQPYFISAAVGSEAANLQFTACFGGLAGFHRVESINGI